MFSFDHLLSLPLYKAIQTLILLSVANQVFSLDVYYSYNQRQVDWRRFLFEGGSDLSMKLLQITPESISNRINMRNRVGRILYNETFKLWSKKTSKVASFNTTFELYIQRVNGEPCGEGMAFILTNNPSVPSNSQGQWLGIVNEETNGLSSNGIVAIEFDTRKSSADDIDDNHVAVDLNGIRSAQQFSLVQAGVNLSSGSIVLARIQYDGESRKLTVYASMLYDSGRSQSRPLIALDIDLSEYLMEDVYVGFSGSTGDLTQLNYIYSWDFTGTNLTEGNNPTTGYIAPECLLTGMASVETDVYGFGVFSMEVACGRRPGNNVRSPNDQGNSILDWLWDLYERERVLDAVDPQLNGVFDEEQMKLVLKLGLACCHPNPNERPSMRLVLQVLSGEAPAPTLPVEKPTFMWPLMPSNSEFAPTSLEEQSCGGGRLTMSMDLTGR
ncbi:hypothetical protein MRB53_014584 [Persea americana]|uniref:Uncharacterized protein n=1 Tax=Persea americana TaxID=3435 RepID=A0ACC2KB89_PERAE|nr:hypothetical protein MRB53_014584 [Persea americana]